MLPSQEHRESRVSGVDCVSTNGHGNNQRDSQISFFPDIPLGEHSDRRQPARRPPHGST